MHNRIGLRREDKNPWERRAPLSPQDVARAVANGCEIWVERFERRCFPDEDYRKAGARLVDDVRPCEIVLGVKEMPPRYFRPEGAYGLFSHTFKGQRHNMPMLAELVGDGCTLIDYEKVTDGSGRRLVHFGHYAGVAGMIESLWMLGERLRILGHRSPLLKVDRSHRYAHECEAKAALAEVGERIAKGGLPAEILPLVVGFTGAGRVSQGAMETFDLLPHVEVSPDELGSFVAANRNLSDRLVKVVFAHAHLVEHRQSPGSFDKREYYAYPRRYRSIFGRYLPDLSLLIHGIYWDARFPKLASAEELKQQFTGESPSRLLAIGDITCDPGGSLDSTVRETLPGDPVYVYDPISRRAPSGLEGPGIAVMAVGNLPAEMPVDATQSFSASLSPFIPALVQLDLNLDFQAAEMPTALRRGILLWHGSFTPDFEFMRHFLR